MRSDTTWGDENGLSSRPPGMGRRRGTVPAGSGPGIARAGPGPAHQGPAPHRPRPWPRGRCGTVPAHSGPATTRASPGPAHKKAPPRRSGRGLRRALGPAAARGRHAAAPGPRGLGPGSERPGRWFPAPGRAPGPEPGSEARAGTRRGESSAVPRGRATAGQGGAPRPSPVPRPRASGLERPSLRPLSLQPFRPQSAGLPPPCPPRDIGWGAQWECRRRPRAVTSAWGSFPAPWIPRAGASCPGPPQAERRSLS